MLLTIHTKHRPATDLGYLLHKHPAKVQEFKLAFGKAHVFYPKANEDECTVALLLDLDPVALVRGTRKGPETPFTQYVNDKPFICSSFMSVAISQVFGSALQGKCKDKPDLVKTELPFTVKLSSLPVRGGERFLKSLFEPLGYDLSYKRFLLDEKYPDWGQSVYYNVKLKKVITLQKLLSHLYVLIPVLDRYKHYWVSQDEVDKLLEKGSEWLNDHPMRDDIVHRYLKYQRALTNQVIKIFDENSTENQVETNQKDIEDEEKLEVKLSLNEERMQLVIQKLKENGATSILDLGCGEGKLLKRLMKEKKFYKITGADVALGTLNIAEERLKLSQMPKKNRNRINLVHSSLMYRDDRLKEYDAACVIEVIEHMELYRLSAFERTLFEFASPETIVITTPNIEYNVLFENLAKGKLRHNDHRFEWTRKEFQDWVRRVGKTFNYQAELCSVGEEHPEFGSPTQMVVFTKKQTTND